MADPSGSHTGHDAAAGAAGAYVDPASARAAVSRGRFLTGVTLGLGGLIGAAITVPVIGLALGPSFSGEDWYWTDLGPTDQFSADKYTDRPLRARARTATSTAASRSCARRRTTPSPSSRNTCMHLGCPVELKGTSFACPCHGGQYDSEGRRTAGPPVRPLNRHRDRHRVGARSPADRPRVRVEGGGRQGGHVRYLEGSGPARAGPALVPLSGATALGDRAWHRHPSPPPKSSSTLPLDWVEERSGLVSLNKYLLFRNVPRDISWLQTLGAALLTTFLIQAVTGVILAMYYHPTTDGAFESIRYITDTATLGWLVRGMHKWGSSIFVILLFLHMGRVFLMGSYKYPREMTWLTGALLFLMRHVHVAHRLPAGVRPARLLGVDRRDQHQRHRADPGAVHRGVPEGRARVLRRTRCPGSTRCTCWPCRARSWP